jgi:23S rRNA pseudouridine2604 synthase
MATLKLKQAAPRGPRGRPPLRGRGVAPPPARRYETVDRWPEPGAQARAQQQRHERPERAGGYPPARDPWGGGERPTDLPRLSKRMSELGLASRREADEWIERGWVRVNGRVARELGVRVHPDAHIELDPRARSEQASRITIVLHKPLGYVSGQAEDGHEPAVVLIRADTQWSGDRSGQHFDPSHLKYLAPAGRLDLDSSGLLVFTQDGRVARRLIGEDTEVDKEYRVRVQPMPGAPPLGEAELQRLRHGLSLDGEPLKPAQVEALADGQLRFVLRQGKKRQIRRMCEAVGQRVDELVRVRIGPVLLGNLPPGRWRYLDPEESLR